MKSYKQILYFKLRTNIVWNVFNLEACVLMGRIQKRCSLFSKMSHLTGEIYIYSHDDIKVNRKISHLKITYIC